MAHFLFGFLTLCLGYSLFLWVCCGPRPAVLGSSLPHGNPEPMTDRSWRNYLSFLTQQEATLREWSSPPLRGSPVEIHSSFPQGNMTLPSLLPFPVSHPHELPAATSKTNCLNPKAYLSLCVWGKCLFVYCLLLPASETALLVCSFKSSYSYVSVRTHSLYPKFVVSISSRVTTAAQALLSSGIALPFFWRNAFFPCLFSTCFSLSHKPRNNLLNQLLLILGKHSFFREVFLHTLKRMMPPHFSGSHCLLSVYSIMIWITFVITYWLFISNGIYCMLFLFTPAVSGFSTFPSLLQTLSIQLLKST